jgi:hypothetical protein
MAWTFILAAHQAAHSLGYHTNPSKPDGSPPTARAIGLRYWTIFCLEKTLCLRLGRCSTISECEIMITLPGGSPVMDYFASIVRLAALTSKVYRMLYSGQAQAHCLLSDHGTANVQNLSCELQNILEQSRQAIVSSNKLSQLFS